MKGHEHQNRGQDIWQHVDAHQVQGASPHRPRSQHVLGFPQGKCLAPRDADVGGHGQQAKGDYRIEKAGAERSR